MRIAWYTRRNERTGESVPQLPGLRRIRERKALSLAELAERSGVHLNTIYRIEHGSPSPRPSTTRKLAAALGIEPEELMKEAG